MTTKNTPRTVTCPDCGRTHTTTYQTLCAACMRKLWEAFWATMKL